MISFLDIKRILAVRFFMTEKMVYTNINHFTFGSSPRPVTLPQGFSLGRNCVHFEYLVTLDDSGVNIKAAAAASFKEMAVILDAVGSFTENCRAVIFEIDFKGRLLVGSDELLCYINLLFLFIKNHQKKYPVMVGLRFTFNDTDDYSVKAADSGSAEKKWAQLGEQFQLCMHAGVNFVSVKSFSALSLIKQAASEESLSAAFYALAVLSYEETVYRWRPLALFFEDYDTSLLTGSTNILSSDAVSCYSPKVFTALFFVLNAFAALANFEAGCRGPLRGGNHEGLLYKAYTGIPAVGACAAELSTTMAVADVLWCDNMAQHRAVLSRVRFLNRALQMHPITRSSLGHILSESDAALTPSMLMFRTDSLYKLAKIYSENSNRFTAAREMVDFTLKTIKKAHDSGVLPLQQQEVENIARYFHELRQIGFERDIFVRRITAGGREPPPLFKI
jgi:hypothetical protein